MRIFHIEAYLKRIKNQRKNIYQGQHFRHRFSHKACAFSVSVKSVNQMTAMIYLLKSLPHSDSPQKIHPVTIIIKKHISVTVVITVTLVTFFKLVNFYR